MYRSSKCKVRRCGTCSMTCIFAEGFSCSSLGRPNGYVEVSMMNSMTPHAHVSADCRTGQHVRNPQPTSCGSQTSRCISSYSGCARCRPSRAHAAMQALSQQKKMFNSLLAACQQKSYPHDL